MKEISASFLSNEDMFKTIDKLNNSTCDYIHIDIMDGKFVQNKYITLNELIKILPKIKKKIDMHLMVNDPTKYIKASALYDISYITIHYEIKDFEKYLNMVKDLGFRVGLSIKPNTKIEEIIPYLEQVSLVLIMSVEPGKSGQQFRKSTKLRIDNLKQEIMKRKLNVKIEVDGGINDEVLDDVENADILVSASYILSDLENIEKLRQNKTN